MGKLSPEEKKLYHKMIEDTVQLEFELNQNEGVSKKIGYVLCHTDADMNNQIEKLEDAGVSIIFSDKINDSGKIGFKRCLLEAEQGDMIVVSSLSVMGNTIVATKKNIDTLKNKGIILHILDLGIIDNSHNGNLLYQNLCYYANFEREIQIQKMQKGRYLARFDKEYREGRKKKYTEEQLKIAVKMLETKPYSKVVKETGISKSTLVRAVSKIN